MVILKNSTLHLRETAGQHLLNGDQSELLQDLRRILGSIFIVKQQSLKHNFHRIMRILPIVYLKQGWRPRCVFKMPHLGDMAPQAPMDTATLVTYEGSPVY